MQLNAVDYVILAILLLSLVAGYRQGMVGAVSGVLGFIAGLVLAVLFYHSLAAWLDGYFNISALLADWLRGKLPLAAMAPQISLFNLESLDTAYKDAAGFLAGNLLLALAFLLIWGAGSEAMQLFSYGLSKLLDGTIFSGVNRGLGAAVVMVKNLLIMAVVLGLILPSLDLACQMGMPRASTVSGYLQHSFLADWLLQWFDLIKGYIT